MDNEDYQRLAKKRASDHLEYAARDLRDHPDDPEVIERTLQAIEAARGLLKPDGTLPPMRRG